MDFGTNCSCTKILIVDDIAFNLVALNCMLKNKFNIIADKAMSGEQAVHKVKQRMLNTCCSEYPIILMDFYMPPGINGADAAIQIKKLCGSYLVCLTSQAEGDFNFKKSLGEFHWYYSKPLSVQDLSEIIKQFNS